MYKIRILVPAIRLYYRVGAKGGASVDSLLGNLPLLEYSSSLSLERQSNWSFERCQTTILKNEFLRKIASENVSKLKGHIEKVMDERLGKTFKTKHSIMLPSISSEKPEYAFQLEDEDYWSKSSLMNTLIQDLSNAFNEMIVEKKQKRIDKQKIDNETIIFDEKHIFACKKEKMTEAVSPCNLFNS